MPSAAEEAFTFQDPDIRESSGLVASQRHEDVYYTHNDSGPAMTPDVYAVDSEGETLAVLRVTGAGVEARDWESVAIREGEDGEPAILVGDIGDNFAGAWPNVRIYEFPEPSDLSDQEVQATTYTLSYEDGGRDAEGMFVDPRDNRLYVASKEVSGGLYAAPEELSPEGTNTLTHVGQAPVYATGASMAPDGQSYIIRTYWNATVYDSSDGVPGTAMGTLPLPQQDQGEGITHTRDGTAVMISSEGEHSPVWRVPLSERHGGPGGESVEPDESDTEADDASGATEAQPPPGGSAMRWPILVAGGTALFALGAIVFLLRRA
ncbi:hypothetical protein J4H86_17380 [Spiractinospora alimapuensis]|nr:hypothetical protein J4H86_17380 [Spiractinospora alimapuensis]